MGLLCPSVSICGCRRQGWGRVLTCTCFTIYFYEGVPTQRRRGFPRRTIAWAVHRSPAWVLRLPACCWAAPNGRVLLASPDVTRTACTTLHYYASCLHGPACLLGAALLAPTLHTYCTTHTTTHHAASCSTTPAWLLLGCWAARAGPALLFFFFLPFSVLPFSAALPATFLPTYSATVLLSYCCTLLSGPALIRRDGIPCESFGPIPADSFLIPLRDTLIG